MALSCRAGIKLLLEDIKEKRDEIESTTMPENVKRAVDAYLEFVERKLEEIK